MLKTKVLTAIIFSLCFLKLSAQNQTDSIEIRKGAFGTVFRQNGLKLKVRDLMFITQSNADAYKEMKIANRNYVMANVFGIPGGFMIGWPIGTAIGGGEPNWTMAGIGAGLIAVEIPFAIAFEKHAKKATRIYNYGLKPKSTEQDSVQEKPAEVKRAANLESALYYTPADSSYQKYANMFKAALQQDKKIISYEFCEYKYGSGKLKSRGYRAKHKYGVNEDYSYFIGTWEYFTKEGALEKTVNYNLKGKAEK